MVAPIIINSVILATSWASLLSGRLDQCTTADDPSCSGGVAAFRAMLRHHQGGSEDEEDLFSAVHLQLLDKNNAFVHMHPLGLAVNRIILSDLMGMDVFCSSPSILLQNEVDYDVSSRDISYMQTHAMPLLLTNVNVPPQNSWHEFTEAVHFDSETGLAVMSVSKSDEELNVPQVESALGSLRYVRKINEENGCTSQSHGYGDVVDVASDFDHGKSRCWLPIVYHSDDNADHFTAFLEGMLNLPREYRPAMIIDTGGWREEYASPTFVDGEVWVASHRWNSGGYFHHKLNVSHDNSGKGLPKLDSVEFVYAPLSPLPEEYRDEIYASEIVALREAADEALENNPVVGYTDIMPITRDSSNYRPCKSGECPIGNLFTDAARWHADADVAFITSGGVRGPGWPKGEVTVSDVWDALPFPNTLCTGYINGVHLFQLLNYSMAMANFEGEDTDTSGHLLQVSGMKVTYNTKLNSSRVVSIDILDKESGSFETLQRLKTYKFATDSFLCDLYEPFPSLLGSDALVVEGEKPGKINPAMLFQEILAGYLNATTFADQDLIYDTSTRGRLRNNTSVTEALNLVQTEDGCAPGMFWKAGIQTCLTCPAEFDVAFSKKAIEFEVARRDEAFADTISLKNHEAFPLAVTPKSLPDWLYLDSMDGKSLRTLEPGESLPLWMEASPSDLEEGTVHVTIGFGVLSGGEGDYPGCVGKDATFDITMRVYPTQELNHLGPIRAVGFTLFGVIALMSVSFAAFVLCHRNQSVVRALQPIFLVTICLGILVMGSALVPLSIDDEMASQRRCNLSCTAIPWLLSMGFSVAVSALFAKLWRVNRLLNGRSFVRVQVRAKDVAMPLVVLLSLNFIILLTWSIVDPLAWQRLEVNGEPWNSYGLCIGSNQSVLNGFFLVLAVLNMGALVLALAQAWRARNISDEYSETKIVGVALYSWFQVLLVGVPVLFMINKHNTKPRYFLMAALISLVCLSMLLIIFVPLFLQIQRARMKQKVQAIDSNSSYRSSGVTSTNSSSGPRISGLNNCRISGLNVNQHQLRSAPREPDEEMDRHANNGNMQ